MWSWDGYWGLMEAVQGKKMRVADQVWENRVKQMWIRVGELYEARVGLVEVMGVGPKYEARVGLVGVMGVGPK